MPDHTELRRKRIAKLERHFGEPIPSHLVPEGDLIKGGKQEDQSSQVAEIQHRPDPRAPSWVGEWNRDDMQEVQKCLRALRAR